MCGGTPSSPTIKEDPQGLSPRVRGNLLDSRPVARLKRSIPACAGEPRTRSGSWWCWTVYPRVCGGTPVPRPGQCRNQGSIPACAGEPAATLGCRWMVQVYPRVCGGTLGGLPRRRRFDGLSPRVRGNLSARTAQKAVVRSIPACAGEPARTYASSEPCWVYPRVCGGTNAPQMRPTGDGGLSPRVRGNLRTGNPPWAATKGYPRVCGGTGATAAVLRSHRRLSPRVRGNRVLSDSYGEGQLAIPACAGEPAALRTASRE